MASGLFLRLVLLHDLPNPGLLMEHGTLDSRMHVSIDKQAALEILLDATGEPLVFVHYLLVQHIDQVKELLFRTFVAENLVMHLGLERRLREESLKHDVVGPGRKSQRVSEPRLGPEGGRDLKFNLQNIG